MVSDPVAANLKELLGQQKALRQVAEGRARKARAALLRVAEALVGGALNQARLEESGGPSRWDADGIADLVVGEVQARLDQAGLGDVAGDDATTTLYEQANAAIEGLEGELNQARREIEVAETARKEAEEQARMARAQAQVLEQVVADLQRRLASTSSPDAATVQQPLPEPVTYVDAPVIRLRPGPEPEWMGEWRGERGKIFERSAALVTVIGKTGECRRYRLAELVGEQLGLNAKGHGGIKRAFSYLRKKEFVEIIKFKQVISGGSTHLLRLTPKGQKAYLFLTKTESAPSLLDEMLRRHKNAEHAFLNLETADLLEAAGFTVDRFPARITLSKGEQFAPDLGAVSPDGELLWIEVECGTEKSSRDRGRKWGNYYEATGGHFVIATAHRRAMHSIKSEITYWASARPLRLWMTNVTEVRAGERGRDNSIWLFQRGES